MTSCQQNRSADIRSIPEAFFREIRTGSASPILITNVPGRFQQNLPIGVYDRGILCRACEDLFQQIDDYGIRVLLTEFDKFFEPMRLPNGAIAAYESSGADGERVMRFVVAVAWRASVSTHAFYKDINLGPYEPVAASVVLEPSSSIPAVFGAVLSRWVVSAENEMAAQAGPDPIRKRFAGLNAFRIYLGKVVAHLKVDAGNFASPMSDLSLTKGELVRVYASGEVMLI